eukprot:TRINITY_DN8907_c0_g1_i1.p1 TRINITY_DN8907_c0_g1~~TRINITY_DN8907_c0_g1_i1.p1  ORF type:complete len:196 (+),score=29.04 TRINITY_DN8907_c0_g1_i1:73-660(+)
MCIRDSQKLKRRSLCTPHRQKRSIFIKANRSSLDYWMRNNSNDPAVKESVKKKITESTFSLPYDQHEVKSVHKKLPSIDNIKRMLMRKKWLSSDLKAFKDSKRARHNKTQSLKYKNINLNILKNFSTLGAKVLASLINVRKERSLRISYPITVLERTIIKLNPHVSCSEPKELSLIHICRCRRYAVCRSRWSPYH